MSNDKGGGLKKIANAAKTAKVIEFRKRGGSGDGSNDDGSSDIDLKFSKLLRNDIGNAERFIGRKGDDFCFAQEVGWFHWTGTHWDAGRGKEEAELAAQAVAMAIFDEAAALKAHLIEENDLTLNKKTGQDDRVSGHNKWANATGNDGRLTAMLRQARPTLTRQMREFDGDPLLFNVQNGSLKFDNVKEPRDTRVELCAHRREDFITKMAPVKYDAAATCPWFDKFLVRVQPDEEVRRFLQRWYGYALTGLIVEQVLVLHYGKGRNGKSTLLDILHHIFGSYAVTLPFGSVLHDDRKRGSEATPDLARLPGARFVSASEPEPGARFSESTLKTITGGEEMAVRHLNKGFFEFMPAFKLSLAMNPLPQIRGQDDGIWRRLLLVPWRVQIPEKDVDGGLRDKLRAEAPGILNWLIEGFAQWAEIGLAVPATISEATQVYRENSDPVGQFMLAATETREPNIETSAAELFHAYYLWCKANAEKPFSQKAFGAILVERGYQRRKSSIVYYTGLWLKTDYRPKAGDVPPNEDVR